jgi:hypothetical protein
MAVHAYTSLGIANPINDKIPEEENIVINFASFVLIGLNRPDSVRQVILNRPFNISKNMFGKYILISFVFNTVLE